MLQSLPKENNKKLMQKLETEPFVCFDVGRALIHLMVGQLNGQTGAIQSLRIDLQPSSGIHQGHVVDIKRLSDALRHAVDLAEKDIGRPLRTFYLGVDASLTQLNKVETVLRFSESKHIIGREDVERLIGDLWADDQTTLAYEDRTIDLFPVIYTLDQNRVTLNPLNLVSSMLGVKGFVLQRRDDHLLHLLRALRYAGVHVEGLMHIGLAVGEAFLTREEKVRGAVVLDLGASSSKFYYFRSGFMQFDAYLPIGGESFTRDIEVVLRCRHDEAELLKFQYGFENSSSDETSPEAAEISTLVPQIMQARLEQLVQLTRAELDARGVILENTPLKLLGGETMVLGLVRHLQRFWPGKVDQIIPDDSEVALPSFTSTYAMMRYMEKLFLPDETELDPSSWIDLSSEAIALQPALRETDAQDTQLSGEDEVEEEKMSGSPEEETVGKDIRKRNETLSPDSERNHPSKKRNEGWRSWFRIP